MPQHAAFLGDHQQTGCIAIEAVHQLELLGIRAQLAERFDHAEAQAAAAMHGDTCRLVEHDKRLVFVDDRRFETLQKRLRDRHRLVALRHAHRRNAHDIACLQLVLRLDPPLVHTHFAFAQNAVNQGFGHTLEISDQKVIDALTGKFRGNLNQLDAGGWRGNIRHAANDNNFLWI